MIFKTSSIFYDDVYLQGLITPQKQLFPTSPPSPHPRSSPPLPPPKKKQTITKDRNWKTDKMP